MSFSVKKMASDSMERARQSGDAWKESQESAAEAVQTMADARAAWDPSSGVLWDYKTIVLTGGFMGRHKEELDRQAFEAHLDRLGAEGYELSWVLLEQALHGEKDGHVMIFKRSIQPPATP